MYLSSVFIFQYLCDGGGAQYPLPLPADSHHGALDQTGLHPHSAQAAGHEAAPPQESHVSTHDILHYYGTHDIYYSTNVSTNIKENLNVYFKHQGELEWLLNIKKIWTREKLLTVVELLHHFLSI